MALANAIPATIAGARSRYLGVEVRCTWLRMAVYGPHQWEQPPADFGRRINPAKLEQDSLPSRSARAAPRGGLLRAQMKAVDLPSSRAANRLEHHARERVG